MCFESFFTFFISLFSYFLSRVTSKMKETVKAKRRRLILVIILLKIICLSLLTASCSHLTGHYLSYPIIVKVAPYTPIDQELPKLSLCFTLSSLINKEPRASYFHPVKNVLNRTVGDLKRQTPPVESAMAGCSYRNWDADLMRTNRRIDKCRKYFKLSKYRMHGYMCYKFEPPVMNYTLFTILHTLDHHRLLYQVAVGSPLNQGYKLSPLLHFGRYPFHDQFYSQEVAPPAKRNISYATSYSSFELNRLPPPYASRCIPQSEPECFTKCIGKHFRKYGIVRNSAFPSEDEDSLIVPDFVTKYRGRYEYEVAKLFSPICHQHCNSGKECRLLLTATSCSPSVTAENKLVFSVETINSPSMLMKMIPGYEFVEYFTEVTSLAGCWISFSFLGLFYWKKEPASKLDKTCGGFWFTLFVLSKKAEKVLSYKNELLKERTFNQPKCEGVAKQLTRANLNKKLKLKITSKLVSTLFMIIVVAAFLAQVVNVLKAYFLYQTKTVISFELDPRICPPSLDVCLDYILVIPSPERPIINHSNYDDLLTKQNAFFNYSLGELVSRAMKPEEVVLACRLRDYAPNSLWRLNLHPAKVCREHFKFTRYYSGQQICYHFEPKDKRILGQVNKKFQWHVPGFFYSLIMNKKIAQMDHMSFTLNYESPPDVPMEFSQTDYSGQFNKLLILSTYVHEQNLLPFPYETNCNSDLGTKNCVRECLTQETLKHLNLLPYSQAYTEDFLAQNPNLHLLKYSDLKNQSVNQIWFQIEDRCTGRCTRPTCFERSTKTLFSYRRRSEFALELGIDSKAFPDTIAWTFARTTLFDLYFQFFCSINFWLGLSMVHLAPSHLLAAEKVKLLNSFISMRFARIKCALRFLIFLNSHFVKESKSLFGVKCALAKINFRQNCLYNILRTICATFCFLHLYYSLFEYLQYHTVMNILSETEKNSTHYSMTVCISIAETLTPKVKIGHKKAQREISRYTIEEILHRSPNISDFITGCKNRGIGKEKALKENKFLLENRIFFYSFNKSYCRSLYKTSKYLNNGFICYVISQKYPLDMSNIWSFNIFNYLSGIFSIHLDRNFLSSNFMVTVSDGTSIPYYSSFWSPVIVKPARTVWYEVSYIAYNIETLPAPYEKDGYWETDTIGCIKGCFGRKLRPLGKSLTSTSGNSTRNARFFSPVERQNVTVQRQLKTFKRICRENCMSGSSSESFYRKHRFQVTKVSHPFSANMMSNAIALYLRSTEYPVVSVVFRPFTSLFQLFISLGSILGIWFGFSAIHLNSWLQCRSEVTRDKLQRIQSKFDRLGALWDEKITTRV